MNRRQFLVTAGIAPLTLYAGAKVEHAIWSRPRDAALTLRNGPDGVDRRPRPPFQFIEEDLGGTNPKIRVADAGGAEWIAKWAEEVHSETFASRLAASAGYFVRTAYFVPKGKIVGCKDLGRARQSIDSDGGFKSAVFKLIAKNEPYLEGHNWGWAYNPFLDNADGLRKLNGLKVMLMLVSNWDAKDARNVRSGPNTAIYEVRQPTGVEHRYAFDDWGGSMGRWGDVFSRSKWDPAGFELQTEQFVRGIDDDGFVKWGYVGTNSGDVTRGISPGDVAWLLEHIGSLTSGDLVEGLRDSGADTQETAIFARSLAFRLNQLKSIATSGSGMTQTRAA